MDGDQAHDSGKPEQLSGYTREQGNPGEMTGPAPLTEGRTAGQNRGMPAPDAGSGAVIGSGASAGGGGGAEDYDDDPVGGGGAIRTPDPEPRPGTGGDAKIGGSR